MIGEITKNSIVSGYQPSQDVTDLTKNVKRDAQQGFEILNRSWVELNDYSPIERANKDQRTFNSFVDESVEDPDEAWKWRGTRSMARNKTMAMHAHLTAGYIIPQVMAQNESQQEDQDMSEVMRDVMEWLTINSNYRSSFLLAAQGMLVNPVTYLEADYCEVYQTVIEKTEQGYSKKEILDEVLSGFNANVLTLDQVLITNVHQQDIQRQRAIIKTRYIEYEEAKAKYGEHANFDYLTPGVKCVFNEDDGLFYDIKDDDHPFLIQEDTWQSRREDAEVCFLNGIYFGKDDVEYNPIKHRDNRNAPKYNIVPMGYERINEHFFFFKSLVNRVGWDDKLLDAIYEVQMNREILDLEMPIVFTGDDTVDTSVVFPGASIAFANKDVKASPLLPPSNGNGYRAMSAIEDSMNKESVSETESGQLPKQGTTAYATSQAASNAKILLSGVKQNLAESIRQYGNLMIDIILQHITAPQLDELTGGLKYRSLVLGDQTVGGKKVSKILRFDESLVGKEMSEYEKEERSLKLLKEVGYPNNREQIYVINPHLASKMKYLVRIEAEQMEVKTTEFKQAMMERLYSLVRQDPNIEPEALLRELLYPYLKSNTENLIKKQAQAVMGQQEQPKGLPGLSSLIQQ